MYELTDMGKPVALVLQEWTKIYGKVYGIQEGLRRTLVISDVEMVHELFMTKFDYFHGRKSSVISGDVNNDPRVHLFESQGIRPTVESSALALMEFFEKEADRKAFDIYPFYKEFTLDVIYRVAMGQNGSRLFVDKEKFLAVDTLFHRSLRHPVLFLASSIAPSNPLLRALYCRPRMAKRSAENDEHQEPTDFIDLLLDARAEEEFDNTAEFSKAGVQVMKRLTREEIAAQCFVFLVAGFDTAAGSLAFCTYLLAKNPNIQKNLQEEIDEYCNKESINYETLVSMKYLDAVIREALRMYPLATFANSRRCMKSTTLGGIPIEEGEYVAVDTMSLHFDREIWGNDADVFRPERWIESSERPSAAFLAFGFGPRQCIGMRLANMEQKLVLAHLLQRYHIVETEDTE
ncbi:Unspecific monooxygenase, partial [Trichostrongylus colubriformis]